MTAKGAQDEQPEIPTEVNRRDVSYRVLSGVWRACGHTYVTSHISAASTTYRHLPATHDTPNFHPSYGGSRNAKEYPILANG